MASGASATRSTGLRDSTYADQIILLNRGSNNGFRDVQAVAKRSFTASVPIVDLNRVQQFHFGISQER